MNKIPKPLILAGAGILLAAAGLFLGLFLGARSDAPQAPTMTFYDDWRVSCPAAGEKQASCALIQDLQERNSGAQVAHLKMFRDGAVTKLTVTMPYDVLIASGMGMSLDGAKPRLFPYHTCDATGCVVHIVVDEALLTGLSRAKTGRLLFADLNKRVIAIPFSLRGFDRARPAFEKTPSKSWF